MVLPHLIHRRSRTTPPRQAAVGATPEYKEFEQKTALKTEKEVSAMGGQLMEIIAAFGKMQSMDPAAPPCRPR